LRSRSSRKTGRSPRPDSATPLIVLDDGERLIVIGELVGAHGIQGEIRLRAFNPDSSVLTEVSQVFLLSPDLGQRLASLERARPHGTVWLLRICDVTTPEAARTLTGTRVAVREGDLPALEGGQFYCYRLIGLDVVDQAGEPLGAVVDVLATGGNDVLVVRNGANEHMIPMVDRLIGEIDLQARRIVVHAIDGLLD